MQMVQPMIQWQGENLRRGLSCKRGRRKYDICVGNKDDEPGGFDGNMEIDEVQKQNREEENEKLNILI